jgi:hypothetical protein
VGEAQAFNTPDTRSVEPVQQISTGLNIKTALHRPERVKWERDKKDTT